MFRHASLITTTECFDNDLTTIPGTRTIAIAIAFLPVCVCGHQRVVALSLKFKTPLGQSRPISLKFKTPFGQGRPCASFVIWRLRALLCSRYWASVKNLNCSQSGFKKRYSTSPVSGFTRLNFRFNCFEMASSDVQRCGKDVQKALSL